MHKRSYNCAEPSYKKIGKLFVPRKSTAVKIFQSQNGERKFVLKHLEFKKYILLDERGVFIWNLIDGKNTIQDLKDKLNEHFPEISLEDIKHFIIQLLQIGFLENDTPKIENPPQYSPFIVKFPLMSKSKSNEFFKRLYKYLWWTLDKRFLSVLSFFIGFAFFIYINDTLWFLFKKETFTFFGSTSLSFLILPLFSIPILIIHEIFHGLACIKYGLEVPEAGFAIYYFHPAFYCDTTDAWLAKKNQRVFISLAGPFSTLVLFAVFIYINLIGKLLHFPVGNFILLYIYICSLIAMYSLYPLLENDGYYILMDLAGIWDLKGEAFLFIKRKIFHINGSNKSKETSKKQELILISYIIGTMYLTILILFNMILWLRWVFLDLFSSILNLISQTFSILDLVSTIIILPLIIIRIIPFLLIFQTLLNKKRRR
jgi:putative peptide zinc metalloprotease protein